MASKKKTPLITTGEPAIETPLGQAKAVADSLDGGPVPEENPPKDRVKLKSTGGPLKQPEIKSIDDFKNRIKTWCYQYGKAFNDNLLLAQNYSRIYYSLKTELIDNHLQYLDAFEPWQHIKAQVLELAHNPAEDIIQIKYIAKYLIAIFPDLCDFLDDPLVATKLSEPTKKIGKDDPIKKQRTDYDLETEVSGFF